METNEARSEAVARAEFLEAVYEWDAPEPQWLGRVVMTAARAWGRPLFAFGYTYDASDIGHLRFGDRVIADGPAGFEEHLHVALENLARLPPQAAEETYRCRHAGFVRPDVFCLNGLDPSGRGCIIGLGAERTTLSPSELESFQRLASHLSSAYRFRRQFCESGAGPGGRWTIVDAFSRDGERYIVAREDQGCRPGLEILTSRERQVVAGLAVGKTPKEVAYDLGIADPTVRVLLKRARSRLGVRTQDELMQLHAIRSLRGACGN